ncbi:MAG: four helix bundle protein [Lentisphaerae bacterium]|nr:four helix bundle protein [Lentisphaerota bacterium]
MEQKNIIHSVEDLKVYQKAKSVFEEFLSEDLPVFYKTLAGRWLGAHQLRTLDSICANMEEGFARKFGKEFKQFLRMSRGSTGEAKGRYKRCQKILPPDMVEKRIKQLDEIQAMLHVLIAKLKD